MVMSLFWNEYIWLPEGTSWTNFQSNGTMHFPEFHDLGYSFVAAALLLILRISLEAFVYLPIGYIFGWLSPETSLASRIIGHLNFGFTAHKSKFKRVAEAAWRFNFYSTIWFFGLYVVSKEPQFYDVDACWLNWPYHTISDQVWYYYIIETGFYWSLLFSTFVLDVRRSDFWEMVVHHLVTIFLLSISWIINFVRVGTLVLLCHDAADILLELGKLCRYARWSAAVTGIFIVFLISWIFTRLVYFPMFIIRSMLITAPKYVQENYEWGNLLQRPLLPRLILAMFCILLMLHFFWTFILLKIAVKSVNSEVDDIREDSDEEVDEEKEKRKTE